jgi:arylsulfatase A-like enzyme
MTDKKGGFRMAPGGFSRREFFRASGSAATLLLPSWLTGTATAAEKNVAGGKPNFVIIYMDDLGYGDVGPFGSKKNRTPNLERMAAEGRKLTSFYAAPLCTASRTTLMTGCYAKRCSMPSVLFPANAIGLSHSEKTLAELLKPQGYATMCVGKWHLGDQPEFLPTRRGFDHYLGLPYSNDMGPTVANPKKKATNKKATKEKATKSQPQRINPPLPLLRDDKVVEAVTPEGQDKLTELYTQEALKFLKANKDRPFFLYLAHTAVHLPWHPGSKFKGKSSNGTYGDWVEEADWSAGQVLDAVRELGLGDNTLVLFSSDNGGIRQADNGPLRGYKGSTWEGGVREPTIAWWPGKIAAGSACDEIACTMDVLPTFVSLAGGKTPTDRVIDGKDIRPLLFGEPGAKTPREAFYYFKGGVGDLEAVRSGAWKYRLPEKALYNLDKDIGETTDVAAENPDVVKRLLALAEKIDKDLGVTGRGPGCRDCARVVSPKPLIALKKQP